ncbi:UNVERIFIED_CONTAM: hypothetical protein Slati_2295900 [Sesamum latifolium]|uniref:RNase H type-1 domain-containing protein n=1 Tax=Sesamum latifolium TaxID=2727402 RepID=A0AAW2W8G2_9LAMI
MEGESVAPIQVFSFVVHYLRVFHNQSSDSPSQPVSRIPSCWRAPMSGYVKMNFDGASFAMGDAIGFGVVARDATGQCLAWLSLRLPRVGNVELTEALAAWEAL